MIRSSSEHTFTSLYLTLPSRYLFEESPLREVFWKHERELERRKCFHSGSEARALPPLIRL